MFHAGDSTPLHVVLGAVLQYGNLSSELIFTVQKPRFLFGVILVLQVHESSIHSFAVVSSPLAHYLFTILLLLVLLEVVISNTSDLHCCSFVMKILELGLLC
jgi:hypothetical protein